MLNKIQNGIENNNVVIVKGISGQGKSAFCYGFLIDNYPESYAFFIRTVYSEGQTQNLVAALSNLAQYNNLIIYIDVQSGETLWTLFL